MKTKLSLLLVAFVLIGGLSACSSGDVSLEIVCDDFYENQHLTWEVAVDSGALVTATLCSNATTGFEWEETAEIGNPAVLEQVDHEFTAPEEVDGEAPPIGSAGKQSWTFKARESGTTTIGFDYSRPWEDGEKGEWTLNATVTVK